MPHAAIAGAGLMGRLIAWRLVRLGWHVSLFDRVVRDDVQSASHVAAAMLSPLAERVEADDVVWHQAQHAAELWPQWLRELQADTHQAVYHRVDGTLVLAHPSDAGLLSHFEKTLRHKLPAAQHERLQPLTGAALAQCEPALAGRFEHGLLLHGEGQLANDELLAALAQALVTARVEWHEGAEVLSLRAGVLITSEGTLAADVVIDARGVGAVADTPGLRGVRGEVITVECPGLTLTRPVRLMHPRYPVYIAPRPGHRFVVGATQLESQDSGPATLRSVLELGSALHSLHPAFGEARVLRVAASLRPAFDDNRPALRLNRGVWQLNGLYRHGYLCGPALVDELVKALTR
jgi:glycine oxidase